MLLAIDNGNTNTKFALCEGEKTRAFWRCETNPRRTSDEYQVWLSQLMETDDIDCDQITGSIISCVVPDALDSLMTLCSRFSNAPPIVIGGKGVKIGIDVLIDRPDQVGADRLANAVGAYGRCKGPLIIIDFGTATTFDVIDGDGNYRGSAFTPGINLSREALHMRAAKLPRVDIRPTDFIIGKSTESAMQAGLYWGYVGMIEGLVARIRSEYGEAMSVVATGGLAPLFADATDSIQQSDPDMTIRGLRLIYELNL
jgi:type III pantothenate kinase